MLEKLRFETRVQLLPVIAGASFILLVLVNLGLGDQSKQRLALIEHGTVPALQLSRDLEEILAAIQRSMQDAVAASDVDGLQHTEELRASFIERLDSSKTNAIRDVASVEEMKSRFEDYFSLALQTSRALIGQSREQFALDSFEEGEAETETKPPAAMGVEELTENLQAMTSQYNAIREQLQNQTKADRIQMKAAFADAVKMGVLSTWANVLVAIVCLLLLVVVAIWVTRGTVGALNEAAGHLAAASSEILALAGQTETNAANEAASVDETRQTMQGMLDAANEISDSAGAVVEIAERSTDASKMIAERIARLNSQAMKISDVSETVRAIADKSDVLALNASLEGTRAGEVGRGFALVGVEMRRLAETVMGAVREIKQLANQIRELSQAAVLASEQGQKLTGETTENARRITLIAAQQRTATQQVSLAMNEVQEFTQQAVSGARQAKATAADLVQTANNLKGLLEGSLQGSSERRPEAAP